MPAAVALHNGWFEDTVPAFLAARPGVPVAFLHADADLYSSTATVLRALTVPRRPGGGGDGDQL